MIADRVRALRLLAGITQDELDVLAGLSDGYVGAIERNKKPNLTVDTLKPLAQVLGTSVGYLAADEGRMPSKTKVRAAVARAQRKQEKK